MNKSSKYVPDATGPMDLWAQMTRIGFESQMIIGMRMAGMMGLVAQSPDETMRMVTEKVDAAQESLQASIKSVSRGDSVDKVMSAALKPYGKRTKANSRRLTRKAVGRGR